MSDPGVHGAKGEQLGSKNRFYTHCVCTAEGETLSGNGMVLCKGILKNESSYIYYFPSLM